jgi:hypothetical protein
MTRSIFFAAFLGLFGCGPDAAQPCKSGDNTCVHYTGGGGDDAGAMTPSDLARPVSRDLAQAASGDLSSTTSDLGSADLSSTMPGDLAQSASDMACNPDGTACDIKLGTQKLCCTKWCVLTGTGSSGTCGPHP